MCYLLYLLPVENNVLQIYTNVACGISTNGSDFLEANSVCSVATSVQLNEQCDCFCTRSTIGEALPYNCQGFVYSYSKSDLGCED